MLELYALLRWLRRFRVDVPEWKMIPDGYGKAWLDYSTHRMVCFPTPVHALVGAARQCWSRIYRLGPLKTFVDRREDAAYRRGFEHGDFWARQCEETARRNRG